MLGRTPWGAVALIACAAIALVAAPSASGQTAAPPTGDARDARDARDAGDAAPVYVVDISGEIDLGLAPYLSRVLDEAAEAGAAAVVLVIDTPGGRLDAVLQMRDALLDSDVRTIAFVDRTAFSAGALIAIAAEEIYLAPGSVLGAATPVDGATGETASAKVVSAVRKTFKSTAETRGRDPRIAEAMVDPAVVIEGLDGPEELLTLTDAEATAWGYADGIVVDRAALLAVTGLAGRPLREASPSPAERLVRFVTSPLVASLLVAGAILLIVGDLLIGGFGLVGVAGLGLLGLFFFGYRLAGLAGWEDLALVALGLALIGLEVFVVPGFGVPGVLGIAALLGGLALAMLGRDMAATPRQVEDAALTIGAGFVAVLLGLGAIVWALPRGRGVGAMVLRAQVADATGGGAMAGDRRGRGRGRAGWLMRWLGGGSDLELPSDNRDVVARTEPARSLVGVRGVAQSDLRPGGIAELGGHRVDVVTEGDYVRAGEPVEVVADERYRRVVRRVAVP
ncbi:MAG: Putative membrane-bound ClpP-class protease associated with aq_911 [uncultured Thermomicrobiales bacterium]|uniref:Membrane-bound ClpP-class protease associated with aq_911 n=1 Tax=uncultured Thermomicrobiales bacterium TaxID=1645740 RepID=A0A6J4U7Z0_9BACT|nr:MAG: Putative membrane-bound ClpP-class protease associated with aq_911 [uncultured Thermomicrobiales bacterium]